MDPTFETFARAAFARAGLDVTDEDLAVVELVHAGYEANSAILEQADTARFPHAPVDPARAPER